MDHSLHQTDLPIKIQILNISVNMARMGELVLKSGGAKSELLQKLLSQTESYLHDLRSENIPNRLSQTLKKFNQEFKRLKSQEISINPELWAERAITWGDILQIRVTLV